MKKSFLITGATGLIGRHILFEILRRVIDHEYDGEIFLLIRSRKNRPARQRLDTILRHENLPDYLREVPRPELLRPIRLLDGDLSSREAISSMRSRLGRNRAHIIHSAAVTTLATGTRAEQDVFQSNYLGTMDLLESLDGCFEVFTFLSTVFSCGVKEGLIDSRYSEQEPGTFRNPYERYKHITEAEVRKVCEERGAAWQILRPSITCGRLMDRPLYYTSKFDAFYGFIRFFYSVARSRREPIRIDHNPSSGLNMVPVDYVAKSVVALLEKHNIEINIAHSRTTPHQEWIGRSFERIGYCDYELVESPPHTRTPAETLYSRMIGRVFAPYLNSPGCEFDVEPLLRLTSIEEPDVVDSFESLVDFAVAKGFEAQ